MRLSGFLSYSHDDQVAARRLVRRLEGWRPPRKVRRETGVDRLQIFRDVEDAELGELSEVIRKALERSEHLIVLCSPASNASPYVGLEIETFAAARGSDGIIPVLVGGRPNNEVAADAPHQDQAFPAALLEHFDEPLAADLRPRSGESRSARRRREREAFFQIVARLLGIAKSDELVRRDRLARRLRAGALAAVLLIAGAAAAAWWWDARPKAGLDPLWRLTEKMPAERDRKALSRLEAGLGESIPAKGPDDRLLIATWNIRDFPRGSKNGMTRGDAPLTYIAAILSHFDIVAVQEMRGDADVFDPARQALLERLGRHWSYVGSGPTDGRLGTGERLGFFFDTRSVGQAGELDEVVLTVEAMEAAGLGRQIARTPVVAAFDIDDQRLWLANAHITFGQGSEGREIQTREFDAFMRYLRRVLENQGDESTRFLVVGDLNFHRPDGPETDVARAQGFFFPPGLLEAGTSLRDHPYDQIILSWDTTTNAPRMTAGGVFRVFEHIYREEDLEDYVDQVRAESRSPGGELSEERVLRSFLTSWRTSRISDHSPKWIELELPAANR